MFTSPQDIPGWMPPISLSGIVSRPQKEPRGGMFCFSDLKAGQSLLDEVHCEFWGVGVTGKGGRSSRHVWCSVVISPSRSDKVREASQWTLVRCDSACLESTLTGCRNPGNSPRDPFLNLILTGFAGVIPEQDLLDLACTVFGSLCYICVHVQGIESSLK